MKKLFGFLVSGVLTFAGAVAISAATAPEAQAQNGGACYAWAGMGECYGPCVSQDTSLCRCSCFIQTFPPTGPSCGNGGCY